MQPAGLKCTVTIARLSPDQTWWFFSCNKCSRKSVAYSGSYRCSSCPCKGAKPRYHCCYYYLPDSILFNTESDLCSPFFRRYKLCVIGTNGTADEEFILFDDVRQHAVGKQVGAVLKSNREGDEIPPDIA